MDCPKCRGGQLIYEVGEVERLWCRLCGFCFYMPDEMPKPDSNSKPVKTSLPSDQLRFPGLDISKKYGVTELVAKMNCGFKEIYTWLESGQLPGRKKKQASRFRWEVTGRNLLRFLRKYNKGGV